MSDQDFKPGDFAWIDCEENAGIEFFVNLVSDHHIAVAEHTHGWSWGCSCGPKEFRW